MFYVTDFYGNICHLLSLLKVIRYSFIDNAYLYIFILDVVVWLVGFLYVVKFNTL